MKKLLLLFVITITSITIHAQLTMITVKKEGKPDREVSVFGTINHLMEARKNNFKNIKGKLMDVDTVNNIKMYETEETFGAKLENVLVNDKEGYCVYVSSFNLTNTEENNVAADVVNDVVKFINMAANKTAEAKYTAKDIHDTDGNYTTELREKAGELVMELITTSGEKSLKIIFYSTKTTSK